jgi:RNA polymerase sigma factor (sigma-70 family)
MKCDQGRAVIDERESLAQRFEAYRAHMQVVAFRLLGSTTEADDAIQEAWIRVSRAGTGGVDNLGGWLTTVVSRVCLNMLEARQSRREEPLDLHTPEPVVRATGGPDPEHEALLADAVGPALLVVLETLEPAERLAFVLHDVFGVPFDEIATIVGRSPVAARQLASRARRHVQGSAGVPDTDRARQRAIVDAFLAAARNGDFGALLALLDPDVVLRADRTAVARPRAQLEPEVRGATAVAKAFTGRAQGTQIAVVDGAVGAIWASGGRPRAVFEFTIVSGKIVAIDLLADPVLLQELDVQILDD